MNSSTSSFRNELKVLVVVAALVLIWEVAARCIAKDIDFDRKHIHEFPTISQNFAKSSAPKIMFLGNSLMLHGIKEDIVCKHLQNAGFPNATVVKIVPVGTTVLDWNYLFRRYFGSPQSRPDIVVMGFLTHHLRDGEPIKTARLGRHFLSLRDMPELFYYDLNEYDDQFKTALCYFSASLGDQTEHKYRSLDKIIPDFRKAEQRATHLLYNLQEKKIFQKPLTFHRMERMARFLKDNSVHGVFVAMPQATLWELNPKIPETLNACSMTLLDARQIPNVTPDDFPDGYHLGKAGGKKLSYFVAERLVEILGKKR